MIKSKLPKKDNETNTSLIQNVIDTVNQNLNFYFSVIFIFKLNLPPNYD